MMSTRALRRAALGATVLALAVSAPATATGIRTDGGSSAVAADTAPARAGGPRSAVDRVADFYGAYIDVLYDSGRDRLADALRSHYLTAGLRASLAKWENTHHHQDGMLRAPGVPIGWEVVYNDSGMGHCWTRVTLTWRDGDRVHRTHLMIQSDLRSRLISGIRTAG